MSDPPVFNNRFGNAPVIDPSLKARMRRFAQDERARREGRIAHRLWEIDQDAVARFKERPL